MAFSFFTKRTEYTSKRLRLIARGLQIFGVVAGVMLVVITMTVAKSVMIKLPVALRDAYVRKSVLLAIGICLSFIVIGRALLHRQRSGAYMAITTIGLPLVYRLVLLFKNPHGPWLFDAINVGLPLVTLVLIGSVWRELGTLRDSEMIEHRPEPAPEIPLTPRNRGYGEPKSLPLEPTRRT